MYKNFISPNMKHILFSILSIALMGTISAQKKEYIMRTVAFYNVENLFDTINDPKTFDDDRTPTGKDNWTEPIYRDHLDKIGSVIAKIGYDITKKSPDFVGLAEIENEKVLIDLINTSHLADENYDIAHIDSPDPRGIDVALLYKKHIFTPTDIKAFPLIVQKDDGSRLYTRDQLVVTGQMGEETFHFIVNHWPSRGGGKEKSNHLREAAAQLNKDIIDSLRTINPSAKIISMGDFNDDTTDPSFKKVLQTKQDQDEVQQGDLYNPMEKMQLKGHGTLGYRKKWNLFDQIFFTHSLLFAPKNEFHYWRSGIYKDKKLLNQTGDYKGFPFRSFINGAYSGGYSDHLPVYIILLKEIEK